MGSNLSVASSPPPDSAASVNALRLHMALRRKLGHGVQLNLRVLVRGEPGNAIVAEVAPLPGELCVHKPGKGAFCGTALAAELAALGATHLLFTGVTTEVCVQTTMREANDRGFDCLVVEDATESYFPEFKRAALEMIVAQGGIVGWSAASAEVCAALATAACESSRGACS